MRVKNSVTTRRRRKKILKMAEGYYGSKHALYKTAHEQVMHSLSYAYRDRKQRKRQFHRLWIIRINAACKKNKLSYNQFIFALKKLNIKLNRKLLADCVVYEPDVFNKLLNEAKEVIEKPKKASN